MRPGVEPPLRRRGGRRLAAAAVALLAIVGTAPAQEVLEGGATRVEFDRGDRGFALGVLGAVPGAEERVRAAFGLEVAGPKTVKVVADQRALDAEVRRRDGGGAPDWAGAVALPRHRLVLLRIDLPRRDDFAVRALLAHEFFHLALADAVAAAGATAAPIPRWFEEGCAQIAAGRRRPDEDVDLRPAAFFGNLLERADLDAAFAGGEGAAAAAYAEAESFLRGLIDLYGPAAPARALHALLRGTPLHDATRALGGFSCDVEWDRWKAGLRADRSWILALAGRLLLGVFFLAVVVFALARRRRKDAALEAKWAEETAGTTGTTDAATEPPSPVAP